MRTMTMVFVAFFSLLGSLNSRADIPFVSAASVCLNTFNTVTVGLRTDAQKLDTHLSGVVFFSEKVKGRLLLNLIFDSGYVQIDLSQPPTGWIRTYPDSIETTKIYDLEIELRPLQIPRRFSVFVEHGAVSYVSPGNYFSYGNRNDEYRAPFYFRYFDISQSASDGVINYLKAELVASLEALNDDVSELKLQPQNDYSSARAEIIQDSLLRCRSLGVNFTYQNDRIKVVHSFQEELNAALKNLSAQGGSVSTDTGFGID